MSVSNVVDYKYVGDKSVEEISEILLRSNLVSQSIRSALRDEKIDGKTLLMLNECDITRLESKYGICLGDKKRFLLYLGLVEPSTGYRNPSLTHLDSRQNLLLDSTSEGHLISHSSRHYITSSLQPDFFKTAVSLGYAFLVTWLTALVMVIVHERVPDSKRYPPLPDIFLDNVPRIKWAFTCCEITGSILFFIWVTLLIFHKYRLILLRRFFALGGTVFLLRCFTMLITSLSVPGTHLECAATDYKIDEADEKLTATEMLTKRFNRAYVIWSGLGMSIQGVRTCGDYMFSGHTVALTLLNFFITEYTPRTFYFLHTSTWLLNMFGIFFILAAHEHYSIDVFIAFYIASRLFLYYHTLANNQALMSHDSNRTKIWFPLFSYFESSTDCIIPNEFDSLIDILHKFVRGVLFVKDLFMLNARRFWDPLELKENNPRNLNHITTHRSSHENIENRSSSSSNRATKRKSNTNKKDDM